MSDRVEHGHDPLCSCGHRQSEHTVTYDWSPTLKRCGGAVFAVDQFDPDSRAQREVGCLCSSFDAADQYQLRQWNEAIA